MRPEIRDLAVKSSLVALSAILPVALVLALPSITHWQPIFPEIFEPAGERTAAASLLGNLSVSLSSISIATIVGAGVILRDRKPGPGTYHAVVLSSIIVVSCLISVYSGYRFQIALADQLNIYRLDMARIGDRLEWQAMATLIAASCLISVAVETFLLSAPSRPAPAEKRRPKRLTRRRSSRRAAP